MWLIERQDRQLQLPVELDVVEDKGLAIGRVGAMIGSAPAMVLVQKGPIDSLLAGVVKTWDVSVLSLQMMGKMLIGQASLQNLSGPLTIADYAGKSGGRSHIPISERRRLKSAAASCFGWWAPAVLSLGRCDWPCGQ